MMKKRNIIIFILFFIVQMCERVTAEWVEIPQFSDDEKVYRGPFNKYDGNQKLYLGNTEAPAIHGFPNVTATIHGFNKINVNKNVGFIETWIKKPTEASVSSIDSPQIAVTEENVYLPGNSAFNSFPSPEMIENLSEESQFEAATTEEENEEDVTVSTIHTDDEINVDENQSNKPDKPVSQENSESEEDSNPNRSFLYFIPVELFKKVHATLKAQPTTLKGKMHFLKNFEKALLAEIHKRLGPVIAPVRRRRDSRGDHGDDDHDDSVGFPSLEGALMAISFLTFAVYLVQLVMMLFRNLGNTPAAGNAGTATVLFNRNKRSDEEFTEHTARILEYVDKYAKTRYTEN